jgi:hypothetical protein
MARPRTTPTHNTCVICNNAFQVTPNQTQRKTCSEICAREELRRRRLGKHYPGVGGPKRTSKREEVCAICGTIFPLSSSQAASGLKTCSEPCRWKHYSRVRGGLGQGTCEGCGEEFRVSRYHIRHGRRFCTDQCRLKWFAMQTPTGKQNPFWKGGKSAEYYGPSWRAARRAAWARDKETCKRCGKTSEQLGYRPVVHHKLPFRQFGVERHLEANQLDNLECLCRSCHLRAEWAEQPGRRS